MIQQSYDWLIQHPGYTAVAFHALLAALYALARHFLGCCHKEPGKRTFKNIKPARWGNRKNRNEAPVQVGALTRWESVVAQATLARVDHKHPVFYATPTCTPTMTPTCTPTMTPTCTPTMTPTCTPTPTRYYPMRRTNAN